MLSHVSRWEAVGAKFPRDDVIISILLLPLQFCTIPDAWGKNYLGRSRDHCLAPVVSCGPLFIKMASSHQSSWTPPIDTPRRIKMDIQDCFHYLIFRLVFFMRHMRI